MIIVSGHIVIDPAKRERAEELMTELMGATRDEAANISYGFYAALDQPGRYQLYEEWEDQEGIDAHNASAHFATFMAAGAEMAITEVSVTQFGVSDTTTLM